MDSHCVEIVMPWKHEIKRLVDLLLATEDLRTVQSLTIEVQRAMHLHIEELQRQLMVSGSKVPMTVPLLKSTEATHPPTFCCQKRANSL
jgi:hypothetical protein